VSQNHVETTALPQCINYARRKHVLHFVADKLHDICEDLVIFPSVQDFGQGRQQKP
jgi:hypothetical protein